MIRILHIVSDLDIGGITSFILNMYNHIDRTQVQFDIVTSKKAPSFIEKEIISLGGVVFYIPSKIKRPLKNFLSLYSIIKNGKYLIIHRHGNKSMIFFELITAKIAGAKYRIAHSHSSTTEVFKWMHFLFRPLLSAVANKHFACSIQAGKWLFGKNDFTIIHNAIDIIEYAYNKKKRIAMRTILNINEELVIGHVGRFTYAKNYPLIIDIFSEVMKLKTDSILILVGDGELKESIISRIQARNMTQNVLLLGMRTDISSLLQAFDIFLFPSHYEGLGMSLIEAQSSGLPCFASSVVPKEVCVTDIIHCCDLALPPSEWAEQIVKSDISYRFSNVNKITEAGYNCRYEADRLTQLYKSYI